MYSPCGVELPALGDRVEDPEVGCGVGAGARGPLPAVLVAGQVAVDQVPHEVPGPVGPLDVQVLDQERGHDHADPVVHPALGQQLAHARVHDRVAGPALGPGPERLVGVLAGGVRHLGHLGQEVLAGALRPEVQHGGVELPPGDLLAVGRITAAQAVQDRPRVDRAPLQVGRHPRRVVQVGPVPLGGVAAQVAAPEPAPGVPGRCFTGLRQGQAGRQVRVLGDAGAVHRAPVHVGGPGVGGLAPAMLGPDPVERGVDLERRAVALGHPARGHRVRRPGADQRDVSQCVVDSLVAGPAVGAVIGADVHRGRAHFPGHGGHHVLRLAPAHDQPAAVLAQLGIQRAQSPIHEGDPRRAGRLAQHVVQDEQRRHRPLPGGGQQSRVIAQAQVPAEPQHGCGHQRQFPSV